MSTDTQLAELLGKNADLFAAYASVQIAITSLVNFSFNTYVEELRVWRSRSRPGRLIPLNAPILVLFDSWGEYYNKLFAQTLQELIYAAGGTGKVDDFSLGGSSTRYALAWLPTLLANKRYGTVLVDHAINDYRYTQGQAPITWADPSGATITDGMASEGEFQANHLMLQRLCAEAGAQYVHVLGPGTLSIASSQQLAGWQTRLRYGRCGLAEPAVTPAELADTTSFHNTRAKRLGRPVQVNGLRLYAEGSGASDAWSNSDRSRIGLLERQSYNFAPYDAVSASGLKIGIDSNGDGISDGVTTASYGVNTGNSFTASIVNGLQHQVTTADGTTPNGGRRLRFPAGLVKDRVYLAIIRLAGSSPSKQFEVLRDGAALASNVSTDASGSATIYARFTAGSTGTSNFDVGLPSFGGNAAGTWTLSIKDVLCFDLTTIGANAAAGGIGYPAIGQTDADLASLFLDTVDRAAPEAIRLRDSATGAVKTLSVKAGQLVVQ